jgi:hypothetical protein
LKNFIKNRAGGVVQDVGPEFKPPYCKKEKVKSNHGLQKLREPWNCGDPNNK